MSDQPQVKSRVAELYFQRQVKEGRRISLNEIANATGISGNTLARWIYEPKTLQRNPQRRIVHALCQYFGVTKEELLGEQS